VKKAAIWFLIGYSIMASLFPKMDFEEVTKLPSLFAHFSIHQIEEPGVGFFQFLLEHYSPFASHNSNTKHKHSDLPMYEHGIHIMLGLPSFKFITISEPRLCIFSIPLVKNSKQTYFLSVFEPLQEIKPPKCIG